MQLLLVQGVGSLLLLLAFVSVAGGTRNPLRVVATAIRKAFASQGGRRAVFAVTAVIALNYLEGMADPALGRWLGWDATPLIHDLEGNLVGHLQAATPHALVTPLAVFYVPGYLAMLIAPLVIWTAFDQSGVARRYVFAFVLNFLVALPFFLLAPVNEPAWSGLSTTRPLLETVWPGISAQLRAGSPVDNSFPSMHVSCVVTALWYAHRNGPARLRRLAWVVVPAIVWSTMALGIHWAADVFAGMFVALGCCLAVDRRARVDMAGPRR